MIPPATIHNRMSRYAIAEAATVTGRRRLVITWALLIRSRPWGSGPWITPCTTNPDTTCWPNTNMPWAAVSRVNTTFVPAK